MFNYTYRITHVPSGKVYVGARSSEVEPEKDLGVVYFSSSSRKDFISEQKRNPDDFEYEVLETFDSREDALVAEKTLLDISGARSGMAFLNGRKRGQLPLTSRVSSDLVSILAGLIKVARKERGVSQEELSERLGVGQATIMRIEKGDTSVAIGTVFEACVILGIPLFGGDEVKVHDLASMLGYMNRLIPERVRNDFIVDDEF